MVRSKLPPPPYFKVVYPDGRPVHGGNGAWPLPTENGPGAWRTVEGPLEPCANGLHFCTLEQLVRGQWLRLDAALFTFESAPGSQVVEHEGTKLVTSKGRLVSRTPWDQRIGRLWAADCAEHVLPLFEKIYPNDKRPRQAIEVARQYAEGKVSRAQTHAAAAYAAYAAADAAAYAAAYAAASRRTEESWQVKRLAFYLGVTVP